jgi:hypothetical protein
MKPNVQLSEEQKRLLVWLEQRGAVSPGQVLAQTPYPPKEAWDMLNQLAEWGLVIMRQDPDSADGMLVVASPTAVNFIKSL